MAVNVDHHERSVNQDSVNRDTLSLHDQNGETLRRAVSAKAIDHPNANFLQQSCQFVLWNS